MPVGPWFSALARTAASEGASVARSVAIQSATQAAMSTFHSDMNPLEREMHMHSESRWLNILPSPDSIIRAWYARMISGADLQQLLSYHGVPYGQGGLAGSSSRRLWNALVDMAKPKLPLDAALKWMRQGRITPARFSTEVTLAGYGEDFDQRLFFGDFENLDASQVMQLYYMGVLSRDEAVRRFMLLGIPATDAALIVDWTKQTPSALESIALWNRGKISDAKLSLYLRSNGYTDGEDASNIASLALSIAPPADLTRFQVREVWRDDVAAKYGLDDGKLDDFRYWMERQGYHGSARGGAFDGPTPGGLDWTLAYWRAHWVFPSADQLFSMYQRLRGDPNDPATWRVPGVQPFTIEDLRDTLRINDYAPGFIARLEAISRPVLRLVDIRNAVAYGIRNSDWAVAAYMDRGHTEEDARLQAKLAVEAAREPTTRQLERRYVTRVVSNYRSGIISSIQATDALTGQGWTVSMVTTALSTEDMAVAEELIKSVVRRARYDYFAGRDTLPNIRQRLIDAGMTEERAQQTSIRFTMERGEGRITLSTEKIQRLVRLGLLQFAEGQRRLLNLGWNETDVILLLAEVQSMLNKDQAKLMAIQDKSKRDQAKELQRLAAQQIRAREHLEARFRTLVPRSTVLKLWTDGVWPESQAIQWLRSSGYADDVIASLMKDATKGK